MSERVAMREKAALRQAIRQRAKEIAPEYLLDSDRSIMKRLLARSEWTKASMVFIYLSQGTEPDTREVIRAAWEGGKRVAVPRCLEGGKMEARQITSFEGLTPKSFGILEPDGSFPLIQPEAVELVVAPCVAADRKLTRLGHGGGYYDRYLAGLCCPVICLCRGLFLLEEVPREALDRPVTMVITEQGTYGLAGG